MVRRCGHCKQLKPDWTAVSVEVKEIFDEKEGDDHVVFAAIDCTAAGADLCTRPLPLRLCCASAAATATASAAASTRARLCKCCPSSSIDISTAARSRAV